MANKFIMQIKEELNHEFTFSDRMCCALTAMWFYHEYLFTNKKIELYIGLIFAALSAYLVVIFIIDGAKNGKP